MLRLASALLMALALVASMAACGDEKEDPAARPDPAPGGGLREVTVAQPDTAARVQYALDRLLQGPVPQRHLPIPRLHSRNLRAAVADLVLLGPATLSRLEDEAFRRPLIEGKDPNPWMAILEVLASLPDASSALVRAWAAPALDGDEDLSLRRLGARALALAADDASGPLLLRYLEAHPTDKEISRYALQGLAVAGDPWIQRGVQVILARGGARAWVAVPDALSRRPSPTTVDPSLSAALAWAGAWMEGSGPRHPTGLPREMKLGWSGWRPWTDPDVPRLTREGRIQHPVGPLPMEVAFGAGWRKGAVFDDVHVAPSAWFTSGREPAAECRCTLALWEMTPYAHARAADEALDVGVDDTVRLTARHCVAPGVESQIRQRNLGELRAILDRKIRTAEDAGQVLPEMGRLIGGLPDPARDPASREVLERLLFELRPHALWAGALNQAQSRLDSIGPEAMRDLYRRLLDSDQPEDRALGLHLVRRARDPETIPLVSGLLEEAAPEARVHLWSTLVLMHADARAMPPAQRSAFVTRFATWLSDTWIPEVGAARAAGLALGLLDFGEPGETALARLIRRHPHPAWAAVLQTGQGPLAAPVVDVLLSEVSTAMPRDRLRDLLVLAWIRFPPEAASKVAGLRTRIPAGAHDALEVVVERVRHRAPRR